MKKSIDQLPIARAQISCTFIEIYNEKVFDLLRYDESRQLRSGLEIREDKHRGVCIPDAAEVIVSSQDEVLGLLWEGAQNRAVAATDMNEHSSRSHTVLQVAVEQRAIAGKGSGNPMVATRSKLNLVDLAGSEKWRTHQLAKFSEQRIAELTSINQSLSTLGNCIRALLQPGRSHVPYRDSKLTRLLQDSLGGNTRTGFVVTMSSSILALEETISTLQFADRAKQVVVHAMVNETLDDSSLLRRSVSDCSHAWHVSEFRVPVVGILFLLFC